MAENDPVTSTTDEAKLVERLRKRRRNEAAMAGSTLINPDGPEAADAIEALLLAVREDQERIEELETMLNAKLPCDVKLSPATTITKGCSTMTLMAALALRRSPPTTEDSE